MSKRPFACLLSALLVLCAIGAADATEPVASVRVAFDRDGITATRVHGMADTDTGRRVTAGDPVVQQIDEAAQDAAAADAVAGGWTEAVEGSGRAHHFSLPNRPAGRIISTMAMMTKTTMFEASG